MRPFLLYYTLLLAAMSGSQAGDLSVQISKSSSRDWIEVGNAWRKDLPDRLMVKLRVEKETSGDACFFKAYFYDIKGKLIRDQTGPNKVSTTTERGIESIGVPESLKPGKPGFAYLALPDDLKDMKTAIVVFGVGDKLVYDIYPGGKRLVEFELPEKDALLKSGKPPQPPEID